MSTLGELLRAAPLPAKAEPFVAAESRVRARSEALPQAGGLRALSVRDEQIRALVQQLFFHHGSGRIRNTCFAPVEASARVAPMCLEVARVLAAEGKYDVGLIDAGTDGSSLPHELQVDIPDHARGACAVSSRLWLVPRQSWWPEPDRQPVDRDLERLRDFMTEFDFSVLCCAPVSWLTARIAQSCDGLVLVLTANKTRRLVAAQIKEQLRSARIPLLGTVLAERRLPVPQGLYRKL